MDSYLVSKTVCVTGAAGFIGSWLVMRLLQRGYTVRATVRDPGNMRKVKHLLELPNADTRLSLWKADLTHEGSFDDAISSCIGVFHVATPLDLDSKDPENEMIKPTINGLLNIMKACLKARTVRRLIFTSSAATLTGTEYHKPVIDETCWTDVEFCRTAKITGIFCFKDIGRARGMEICERAYMDFISVIPPHVVGPFLMNSMPPSFMISLSLITGNEGHYSVLKKGYYVHLDDLCMCHIFLFEHPQAEGRYICSSHKATIHGIAKLLSQKYPEYNIPTKFGNIPEDLEIEHFSTKKIKDLGFQFKYSLENMFTAAIDTCREKGLLHNRA